MAKANDSEMSLVGHLSELRIRLIIGIAAVAVSTLITFVIAGPALKFLTGPIEALSTEPGHTLELRAVVTPDGQLKFDNLQALTDPGKISRRRMSIVLPADPRHGRPNDVELVIGTQRSQKLRYKNPLDPFLMQFKIALILGVLLALPIILHQIWRFVQPGLTAAEQRVVKPLLSGAIIMFPIGATFAYFMLRLILLVMQSYQVDTIEPLYDASEYLSLLTTMMLVFGVIFEMPLALALATRIGLINPRLLTQYRRHAYVGLAVAAMILTPNDGFTMLAAFFPMIGLYELSVFLCRPLAALRAREQSARQNGADQVAQE